MRNAEIADAFDELGTLYEIDGANRYRVLAYRTAAKIFREAPVSIAELSAAGRLTSLEGVGETIAEKAQALLAEGEIPAATKLKERIPPGLVELTSLPGIGPKTVRLLFEELGIDGIESLGEMARAGRLRDVKGLGAKVEENVLAALDRAAEGTGEVGRHLVANVMPIVNELLAALRADPACEAAEVGGSIRRLAETCKDIDLAVASGDPARMHELIATHGLIDATKASGPGKSTATTHNGITVEIRVVPAAEFGSLLQHLTGSAAHNVALRERAVKMGLSVSEHGIAKGKGGKPKPCATEAEVYKRLGLAEIPPELREDRGEIAAAEGGELPELIGFGELRGDLHCHTTLSDGKFSLEEMAEAAKALGYSYLAVTDHSASHGFGDDVQADALLERVGKIAELNASKALGRFRLLSGSEVNIGTDGELDYDDEVLARLDWVMASVHTSFRMSGERMTDRVCEAMRHPMVDCVGHLTGRLIGRREPYDIDVERVIEVAAETGTMLEINGNPNRRDLSERHARMAADAGVPIVVCSDGHRTDTLQTSAWWGVATARRAWLTKAEVANTLPWTKLDRLRKRR